MPAMGPKGSRNRKSLLAEEFLDSHAEAVVASLNPRNGEPGKNESAHIEQKTDEKERDNS